MAHRAHLSFSTNLPVPAGGIKHLFSPRLHIFYMCILFVILKFTARRCSFHSIVFFSSMIMINIVDSSQSSLPLGKSCNNATINITILQFNVWNSAQLKAHASLEKSQKVQYT